MNLRPPVLFFLFGAVVLAAIAAAGEAVQGVSLPMFDANGRLIRRLIAENATDLLKDPKLKSGRMEIFGPDSLVKPSAELTFSDALYLKSDGTISSDHDLKLVAADGMVSGRRFVCRMTAGVIEIKEAVVSEAKGYRLTSQAARVRYDPAAKGKEMLREIVATGKVEVTPLAGKKLPQDLARLETNEARYDADGQRILVRYPIIGWNQDGSRGEMENTGGQEFLPIDLKE